MRTGVRQLISAAVVSWTLTGYNCLAGESQTAVESIWFEENLQEIGLTVQNAKTVVAFWPKAADDFIVVQQTPAFENSRILRRWKAEFLSYPDLAQANKDYWQKRNLMAFLRAVALSSNFRKIAPKYAQLPEFRAEVDSIFSTPNLLQARGRIAGLFRL